MLFLKIIVVSKKISQTSSKNDVTKWFEMYFNNCANMTCSIFPYNILITFAVYDKNGILLFGQSNCLGNISRKPIHFKIISFW